MPGSARPARTSGYTHAPRLHCRGKRQPCSWIPLVLHAPAPRWACRSRSQSSRSARPRPSVGLTVALLRTLSSHLVARRSTPSAPYSLSAARGRRPHPWLSLMLFTRSHFAAACSTPSTWAVTVTDHSLALALLLARRPQPWLSLMLRTRAPLLSRARRPQPLLPAATSRHDAAISVIAGRRRALIMSGGDLCVCRQTSRPPVWGRMLWRWWSAHSGQELGNVLAH